MEKKTTGKPEAAKAAVKETTVTEKAAAAVKEAAVETKEAVKKAEKKVVEKAAAVKETAKAEKAVAKKAAEKKPEKKEELKPEVFVQFSGREAVVADVIEKAKKQFEAEGHKASSIKSIQVYLKPEDYAAYYVINQKYAGRVDLF